MTRRLIVSDIHGEGDRLLLALEMAGYDSSLDKLFLLGDYVDRGVNSKITVEIVMKLVENGAVALLGNHDRMMVDALMEYSRENNFNTPKFLLWYRNGGYKTLDDYGNSIPSDHIEFLKNLPLVHVEDDCLFVHAGFNPLLPLDRQEENDLLWIRDEFHFFPMPYGKHVYFGHTPTPILYANDSTEAYKPWHGLDKTGIDTGACFGGKLTVMDIDTKEIWQA